MPTIICDSREQKWGHVRNYLERAGIRWLRSKLPVGDYGRMDNLSVIVDRKASLTEVEGNLIQQHDRFRREAVRAQENGIRLIVLVEAGPGVKSLGDVAKWENPRLARWRQLDRDHSMGKQLYISISAKPPVNGSKIAQIMHTMSEKYGIEWQFCCHQDAGQRILELLGVDANEAGGGENQGSHNDDGSGRKPWTAC